ncbi:2Fe-2S iron-sulfur cluster-binding protein [Pelagicoccus sp. SDUM812002]|uniref:(2Fe-2S)-binding protein n=1 Tax=Pelagicoccus sp. SDUM812002 TaxID=3041266 RepID=UPI0028106E9E|nr:2Fe-2S iron-sulfur cluster-binding protein [Pelagicoccus sp. SDUM812002]MDQ8187492.1 (2Fe-2S)-binding protein [Pelagicoccus sp. SDUM812002]
MAQITLSINSRVHEVDVDSEIPLLWVLRDTLGLTGTKFGCGIGQCGCCTVHLGETAVRSCQLPVGAVSGMEIRTIEGLSVEGLHPVQEAWCTENVAQCGYCQAGQIMSAVALLKSNSKPNDEAIDVAMSGNLCRCGTYKRIRKAIHLASKRVEEAK